MSTSAAVSQSANMSDLLPTHFIGTTMNAVQNDEGKFRVYFQNKDYQIHEMSLNDPKSTAYTLIKLTNSNIPAARINTPIAAVASNDLEEVCVLRPAVPCLVVSFSFHYYRSTFFTSPWTALCRRFVTPSVMVGRKARPLAPLLRTAPVCMRKAGLFITRPCSGSGSSLQPLHRPSQKVAL
ncbi:hypothetical protein BDR06DRAFT_710013 [Suillus hirtellus]|nr:hypothetical protein BDR06DRAFT_710013 [Suillus hirtellus]